MRVLYLDINIQYSNPTRNLIPNVLDYKFDVTYFGPGYVSNEVFNEGIIAFLQDKEEFDFIITNEKLALFYGCSEESCFGSHHYMFRMDHEKYIDGMFQLKEFFYNYKKDEKIVFLLETDYYAITDEYHIDAFNELDCYFVGFGKQFIEYVDNLENIKKEKFGASANDKWKNFVELNDHKIISFPGIIGESEFSYHDWSLKKNYCEVPGTEYYLRKEALKVLKDSKYKAPYKLYNKIYSLLRKLNFPVYGNKITLKLYNLLFAYRIERSKFSFTCGSGLNWPIRKFFEIPALGSILLSSPCSGFEELGFKDKKNCLVTTPDNLIDNINYLMDNPKLSIEIAKNGRKLIMSTHSTTARSQQLYDSILAIKEKKFFGTYWEHGNFNIKNTL